MHASAITADTDVTRHMQANIHKCNNNPRAQTNTFFCFLKGKDPKVHRKGREEAEEGTGKAGNPVPLPLPGEARRGREENGVNTTT